MYRIVGNTNNNTVDPVAKTIAELDALYDSIDPMLQDIISLLWKNNIITRFCCQGHIENSAEMESGYIYMDFSMLAFNAFSTAMFSLDKFLRETFPRKEDGNRSLYYPYLVIERTVRQVEDNYSKDELSIRFRFHPANVIKREEFYMLLRDELYLALNLENNKISKFTDNVIEKLNVKEMEI